MCISFNITNQSYTSYVNIILMNKKVYILRVKKLNYMKKMSD